MNYSKPSRDKFPNRGRWSPARWRSENNSIPNPPPKANEYKVYGDWNIPDPDRDYDGDIKVETDPKDKAVILNYYPVLRKPEGYENGLLHTYPGYPPSPGHDFFDPVHLAPRPVAIVVGKVKSKVLTRARREALYLSTEPDEIGPRIISPVLIDIDEHKMRRAYPVPGMASA